MNVLKAAKPQPMVMPIKIYDGIKFFRAPTFHRHHAIPCPSLGLLISLDIGLSNKLLLVLVCENSAASSILSSLDKRFFFRGHYKRP